MYKRYNSVVAILLCTYADYRACHSENQIEPAIRNGELCEIGCPESANVLLWNRFRTDRFTRLVPAPVHFVLRNDLMGGLADNNNKIRNQNGEALKEFKIVVAQCLARESSVLRKMNVLQCFALCNVLYFRE